MADVHAALTGRPTPPARPTARRDRPRLAQLRDAGEPDDVHARGADAIADRRGDAIARREDGRRSCWGARARRRRAVADARVVDAAPGGRPSPSRRRRRRPRRRARGRRRPPSPLAAASKPPPSVTAAIVSDPPGARVVREKDGAVIGMTPFRESWPSGDGVQQAAPRARRLPFARRWSCRSTGASISRSRCARSRAARAAQAQGQRNATPARPPAAKVPGGAAPAPAPKARAQVRARSALTG